MKGLQRFYTRGSGLTTCSGLRRDEVSSDTIGRGYMSVKSAKRRMLQNYGAAWRCDEGWAANETSMELEFAFVNVIELVG